MPAGRRVRVTGRSSESSRSGGRALAQQRFAPACAGETFETPAAPRRRTSPMLAGRAWPGRGSWRGLVRGGAGAVSLGADRGTEGLCDTGHDAARTVLRPWVTGRLVVDSNPEKGAQLQCTSGSKFNMIQQKIIPRRRWRTRRFMGPSLRGITRHRSPSMQCRSQDHSIAAT